MKKITLLIVASLFATPIFTQNEFITTWQTTTANESITIPTNGSGYNYDIDWNGDNIFDDLGVTGNATHTYPTAGVHTVQIRGAFPSIFFNLSGDRNKIRSVEQWGAIQWTSMDSAFYGCQNLVLNATDAPNLTNVTSMLQMFRDCSLINQDISNWDVSNIATMESMFRGATAFNQDIGGWNISSLTTARTMFLGVTLSTENYDSLLNGWATLGANETQIPQNIIFSAGNSTYCLGFNSRESLINNNNWNIFDGGLSQSCEPSFFITTWQTTTANESITIPTTGSGYNYDIDWNGDNIFDDVNVNGNITHTYPSAGTHTVKIRGNFPRIFFNLSGDRNKIRSVEQWGAIQWTSMDSAFRGCTNLVVNATDAPDLSNVTALRFMFGGCASFNQALTNWDVSNVTLMSHLFSGTPFNQDISGWAVTNVTDMSYMFNNTSAFNQDISSWTVSNVTNMEGMFADSVFNQNIGGWNVENVTNMFGTFANSDFNQNIGNWDVNNVTNMSFMFSESATFNQDISNWDVSSVTNMDRMFRITGAFNQDIGNWDVSNVTNMTQMFSSAMAFDQDLKDWDISNLTTAFGMFSNSGLSTANYDNTLIGWSTLDTGETQIPLNLNFNAGNSTYCLGETARANLITNFSWTITDAGLASDCDTDFFITTWQTTSANETITIPTLGGNYNYDVDWNGDNIFDDLGVTANATHTYPLAGTHTVQIRGDFPAIFFNNTGDKDKILSVEQWGTIAWSSMAEAFAGCSNLAVNATDAPDLSNVTSLRSMFNRASSFNQDIGFWVIGNVTELTNMFGEATNFNQDISAWDTSNVSFMQSMFSGASSFNQDISAWDVSAVTTMNFMFDNATTFNQDLNSWDVRNVTTMRSMFRRATNFNGNISNWEITNLTDLTLMFFEASSFNQDISGWNVSNILDYSLMFFNASSFNQDLSAWNVDNAQAMGGLFDGATNFNQDLSAWDISNVFDFGGIFDNTALSTQNYDAMLIAWSNLALKTGVDFGANNTSYCNGDTARTNIITSFGWTFFDAGLDCTTLSLDTIQQSDFNLYPNPAKHSITLAMGRNLNLENLKIYDISGRLIKIMLLTNTSESMDIDISDLSSGTYFVKITSEQGWVTKKFLKQ